MYVIDVWNRQYVEHKVFARLKEFADFYDFLSSSISGWVTQGTKSIVNLDYHVYKSIHGTLKSVEDALIKGRINDAYSLLRKFYDCTIINVYSNLYLEDNRGVENFFVVQIDNWVEGKDKLPEYRIMSRYIKASSRLSSITSLLERGKSYKGIRDRCWFGPL